jgi:putative endonuclease
VGRYLVYILKCSDGTLYTGITNDLLGRLALHNAGRASRYTRSRTPVKLAYVEDVGDKGTAL